MNETTREVPKITLMADMELTNDQGKPIVQLRFKHKHGYVIYREFLENMSEEDIKNIDGVLKRFKVASQTFGYAVFNFDDMRRQMIEKAKTVPPDGKRHDVQLHLRDMVTGETGTMVMGITAQPRGEEKEGEAKND